MSDNKPATFEEALERSLMDGTVARAMEILADEYEAGGANYIDVAAMREASSGLNKLVTRISALRDALKVIAGLSDANADEAVVIAKRALEIGASA